MKLSLMTINLTMPIFLDEHFQPGTNPDFREYEAVFQHAQAAGFDAVDLGGGDLMAFGAERVAALLKKYGLTCASVINFGNYTSLREEDILQNENLLRMLIDACVEVETKVLMLVAGWPQPGQSREEIFQGLCANLTKAVEIAGNRLRVCVEDFPSTEIPMSSAADLHRLLDAVPGMGLVYDSANMMTEGEDPIGFFHSFAEEISYYHLKDVRILEDGSSGDRMRDGRSMVTTQHGNGVVDLKALSHMLKLTGYEGYLSVEYADDPALNAEPWKAISEEKEYLEEVLEIRSAQKEKADPVSLAVQEDPSDANIITRKYLDGIWFEERLLDADLPDISCSIFGEVFSTPVMPAAFSHLVAFSEGRESGMLEYSRAAKEMNVLNWVGMMDDRQFQSILDTGARTVRIVKPYADREKMFGQLQYAADHGAIAVGLDIDHSFDGKGNYDLVFGEAMAPLTQAELKELTERLPVPFVIKGVLGLTDAVKCARNGVKGILVSHHHGRLPFSMPPAALLPEIRKELEGSGMKIFADCHIDSGYDAYKALALGADAVCVGRAMLPPLRKDGVDGVKAKFSSMNEELKGVMCYTGVRNLDQMDISVLRNF